MMDRFLSQRYCDRCGGNLKGIRRMSRFNEDCLCLTCQSTEQEHSEYAKAVAAEVAAIKNGEINYPGIGLPKDMEDVGIYSLYVKRDGKQHESKWIGKIKNVLSDYLTSEEISKGYLRYLTVFDRTIRDGCIKNTYKDIEVCYYPTGHKTDYSK